MAATDPSVVVCVWRRGGEELTGAQTFRNTSAFSGKADRSTGVKVAVLRLKLNTET